MEFPFMLMLPMIISGIICITEVVIESKTLHDIKEYNPNEWIGTFFWTMIICGLYALFTVVLCEGLIKPNEITEKMKCICCECCK